MIPPPQSYAYVNSASETNVPTAKLPTRRASSPALPSSTAVSSSRSMKVEVDGEDALVAAAPGAVRRALRHQGSRVDRDMDGEDAAVALLRSVAHPLVAAFRNNSCTGSHVPGSTASLTPAERHAHRQRQRKIREARGWRRQDRAQQQGGAAMHPCRLQGGCQHQLSGTSVCASAGSEWVMPTVTRASVCPYRHYPSHYCVTQLRNGHCSLHDVGCCPWTHGDPSEGVGRVNPVSTPSDADTNFNFGLQGLSPLVPLESTLAEATLRRSAAKVGVLLLLFLDIVSVMMEEASTKQQIRFVRDVGALDSHASEAPLHLSCWWESLTEVAGCSSPTTVVSDAPTPDTPAGVKGREVGLRLEVVPNGDSTDDTRPWRMLSVPTELARCALASHSEGEASSSFSGVDPNAVDTSPFTAEERGYWSSYFTLTAPSRGANERYAATGVCRDGHGALHDGVPDQPRVRLTPCVTAWVFKAAAAQLRAKSCHEAATNGLVDEAANSAAPATMASAYFDQATLYVLKWRRAQLQRCLMKEGRDVAPPAGTERSVTVEASTTPSQASAGRHHELQHKAESPLRWSPVLFLKDALLCTYLLAAQPAQAALEQEMIVDEDGVGASAEPSRGINPSRCTTLLDVFLGAVYTSDATVTLKGSASAPSRTDGALFNAGGSHPAARLSSSPSTQSTLMAAKSPTAASMQSFRAAWDEVHAVVVQLHKGLLQCFGERAITASALLCLYTQPAMLHIISSLSIGFAQRHEADLRSTAGWKPWTDVQLFLKEHAAVYNADTYARHHMPAVRLGLQNSLLNALLVLTTHHVDTAFQLQESSDVRRVLLSSPAVDFAVPTRGTAAPPAVSERQAVSWWCTMQKEASAYRQQHLQSSIAVSMGLLTALQEHSREQLEARDALMREYEQRRSAYERSHDTQGSPSNSLSRIGASRVRKYYAFSSQSTEDELAEQQQRLEELHGVALLDRLLPFGSATVSPDATASLLRQLLEGGYSYKALKLAASIMHASRMLRHADKQPRPSLHQGFRTVHSRVWSRRTQRHVLVKKRVPVLRLVGDLNADDPEGAEARPGVHARRSVRPVGLAFVINDRVVVEMARIGLRMGEAGAALVNGVVQDCQRGALLDFTYRRGLPAPVWEDVAEMLSRARLAQSLSSVVTSTSTSLATTARSQQLHEHKGHSGGRRGAERGEAALLVIIGVGGGEARPGRGVNDGRGAVHQRIAPTPALLEVLETHTHPSSTAQHTAYLKLLLQDVTRFSTVPVLLALQYQACFKHSRYATSRTDGLSGAAAAMQTAYVLTLSATGAALSFPKSNWAPSFPTTAATAAGGDDASRSHPTPAEYSRLLHVLRIEAETQRPAVQEAILSDASSFRCRRGAEDDVSSSSSLAASRASPCIEDVKALLLGTSQGGGAFRVGIGVKEKEGAPAVPAVRRRAKLSLAVLLHHLWTSSILARSTAQQATSLWAVCTATLLGLAEAALRRSQGSSDTERGGLEADSTYAALALHHAYVAAGPLLRQVSPQQSPSYVDATVKALLLCRPLAYGEGSGKDNNGVVYAAHLKSSSAITPSSTIPTDNSNASTRHGEHLHDEWPMLLSSASATRVRSLPAFLALQCALCTAVYTTEPCTLVAEAPLLFPVPTRLSSLLEDLVAARVVPPERVREWPAWKLFAPLLWQPVLAQMWLHDTLLCPSSSLLMWLVGSLSRDDVEGYAILRAWLGHIQPGPRLSLSVLQGLHTETEHHHRSAVTCRLRRHRR
uniref:Uncharacterized protein n=1 Tax=Leishmania guyanensis TaxID=5670 RepID=A0A1E1ISG5_LEIGU|nr:hypothetical protein, conserved [Leishmania guyanensis]